MSHLRKLIRSADHIKNFESYFEKLPIDRHTINSLKIQQNEVKRLWSDFRACYEKALDKIDDVENADVQSIDTFYFAAYESYLRGLARINELLDISRQETEQNDNNTKSTHQTAHISVPPYDIETFHPVSPTTSHQLLFTTPNPPHIASPLNTGKTSRSNNPLSVNATPLTQTYTTDDALKPFSMQLQPHVQTCRLQTRSSIENQLHLHTDTLITRQLTGQLSYYPHSSLRDNSYAHLQMANKDRNADSTPFKPAHNESLNVSASRNIVKSQSLGNENKPYGNHTLQVEHDRVITEYAILGQRTNVNPPNNKLHIYYLLHNAVTKPDIISTKQQLVFNASSSSSNGKSQNNIFHPGPVLPTNLTSLLQWRFFQYMYTLDSENINRQIRITYKTLSSNNLWWYGPPWRKRPPNKWPSTTSIYVNNKKSKAIHAHITQIRNCDTFKNVSNITKALRVAAHIFRPFNRIKEKPPFLNKINNIEISTYQLLFEQNHLIIANQHHYFNPAYHQLSEAKLIVRKSHILPFNTFIDPDGSPFYPLLSLNYANCWQNWKILYQKLAKKRKERDLKERRKRTRWKYPQKTFDVDDLMVIKQEKLITCSMANVHTSNGVIIKLIMKLIYTNPLFNIMTITHSSFYLIIANSKKHST